MISPLHEHETLAKRW